MLSSAYLEKGEVLIINAMGLEEEKSLRKAGDGFTYFGCKKSIKKSNKGSTYKSLFGSGDKTAAQMGATGTSIDGGDDSKYMASAVRDLYI